MSCQVGIWKICRWHGRWRQPPVGVVLKMHGPNLQSLTPHLLSMSALSTQSAPLEEAEMSLKDFDASGGDVEFLKDARSKAMTALVQGHSLDVKLSAAIIAVAAGYVYRSKVIYLAPCLTAPVRCTGRDDAALDSNWSCREQDVRVTAAGAANCIVEFFCFGFCSVSATATICRLQIACM